MTATPRIRLVVSIVALAGAMTGAVVADSSTPAAGDWPQFRGPAADGASSIEGVFEQPAGTGLRVAWKQPLGSGYASVAAAGGRVVTAFTDGTDDFVIAFDETSGAELWRYRISEMYPGLDGAHSGPLSTPLVTAGHVVSLGGRGEFFGLDAATGKELWRIDLVEKYKAVKPHYGFSTSPALVNGLVILELGGEATIGAFEIETGELRWSAGTDQVVHQNPTIVKQDGKTVIVAAGQKLLMGIDPTDGTVLWEYEHNGGGARGVWSMAALPAGDGRLFLAHKDDASTVVDYRLEGDKAVFETRWENNAIRNSYNLPVYHEGHVYAFSSRFLTCVDAATGEAKWRSREPGDGWMMLVDGHLVIVTKDGTVHVAPASPDGYKEVAGLEVFDELAWAPPAFAGGNVYARSLSEIARIDIGRGRSMMMAKDDSKNLVAGTAFGKFLDKVAKADDKSKVVDDYLASVEAFPIIARDDVVVFVYRGAGTDLAVGADIFGARQERSMQRIDGTDLFYAAARIPSDTRSNYMFLRDYEQLLDPRNDRVTETQMMGKEMEMNFSPATIELSWFAMPEWSAPEFLAAVDDGRKGRLDKLEFESATLGSGVALDVYLPAVYDESDARYPVIYQHSGGGAQTRGHWQTALDNLIGTRIQPVVVVFIDGIRAQGPQYNQVFAEIVPAVDGKYRTVAEASARASVAAGFQGAQALATAIGPPGVIGKVATQSAFYFDSVWAQLVQFVRTADEQPLDIYMDWGAFDMRNPHEAWDLGTINQNVASALKEKGYRLSGGPSNDGTGWSSWANRTDELLVFLFPLKSAS